mgnify:CR=1 FL=1|tara:strand:- start:188 stop:799 length:612 start_codon:yes stop_codon:yes gene_type:complete
MADFGWAYLSGAVTGQGVAKSVQYLKTDNGELTGSQNFTFNQTTDQLFLTGTIIVSGTLQANTFDVIHTNKIELSSSGGTNFGDGSDDNHIFTGSVSIVSGGLRQHYYNLAGTSHTVQAYDSIIGVGNTNYVSITLPAAATAGFGKILIIKDETSSTRSDTNRIAVSGAGGSEKIDRETTYSLTGDNPALTLYSNGIDTWFIY